MSYVKAATSLGCFLNGQRPEQGLTLVPEFLTCFRTLSFDASALCGQVDLALGQVRRRKGSNGCC
jgi:hypothetical protein